MAKPNPKASGKTPGKPHKDTDPERTQRLPHLQKVVDEHFTNWPSDQDNQKAGGK